VIKVEVIDAEGRAVPTADNKITFGVSGAGNLIGVGNGDPSGHEPDKANARSLFNGLAQAIVQTTTTPGSVEIVGKAQGLKPSKLTLQTVTAR